MIVLNQHERKSWHDECGVAGVHGHPEAANLVYLALYALQHRGQESAGIVSAHDQALHRHVGMGLVADVFTPERLAKLPGQLAVGHVRYGTAGGSTIENAQPLAMSHRSGGVALAHNGNLVNAHQLRATLENDGAIFRSNADTECILHLMARSRIKTTEGALTEALTQIRGAYSLVVMDQQRLIAVRDPYGFRPLSLGRLAEDQPMIASESCAFDLVGARFERDIAPGEMFVVGPGGNEESHFPLPSVTPHPCIFEYVYFSRPDSVVFGRPVSEVRRALGAQLAREQPVEADLCAPVPDSGVPAATGFAHQSGLPFDFALVRNHYVGRTFIEPAQSIRHFGVKIKLNAVRALCGGKRIVLVDDSLVRGTTMAKIVSMMRQAGAREVHVRISCPPTIAPCYYGVDTPDREELIASHTPLDGIQKFIGADSLGYLSLDGMVRAVGADPGPFCTACYTDTYPVPIEDPAEHRRAARSP
jgi:amidophosphoribosyltransferase